MSSLFSCCSPRKKKKKKGKKAQEPLQRVKEAEEQQKVLIGPKDPPVEGASASLQSASLRVSHYRGERKN
jgi:hypothetical protein